MNAFHASSQLPAQIAAPFRAAPLDRDRGSPRLGPRIPSAEKRVLQEEFPLHCDFAAAAKHGDKTTNKKMCNLVSHAHRSW